MSTGIPITLSNADEAARIAAGLLKEFEPNEIKRKPAMVKGNRALCLFYIDSRLVMDRLDEVVGVNNWRDEYTVLPNGEVECRLSVRIAGEWITKADVGGRSEQPDEGDQMKAAFSDALKRAAVKFGIGRFLYRMPQQWLDYDPVKKQFQSPPAAPAKKPTQPAPQQQPTQAAVTTVAGVFKTLASRSPTSADQLKSAVEYAATKLAAIKGGDRTRIGNDILEAITQAAKLPEDWQWARLGPQNVTDGYAALVGYVKGEMTAKAGAA